MFPTTPPPPPPPPWWHGVGGDILGLIFVLILITFVTSYCFVIKKIFSIDKRLKEIQKQLTNITTKK